MLVQKLYFSQLKYKIGVFILHLFRVFKQKKTLKYRPKTRLNCQKNKKNPRFVASPDKTIFEVIYRKGKQSKLLLSKKQISSAHSR